MRNKKIIFYFCSILCVISSIYFYTWKAKQDKKYMVLKADILENDIQNIVVEKDNILEKINAQMEEKQEKINALQAEYDFLRLLEQKSNSSIVFEKYFHLKQGELARRQGIKTSEDCGMMGFLNSHFGGITLNIDEGIYVQYYNLPPSPILEDLLPSSLIITNPDIDLGFMNAQVGMDFEEIQENAYETEINKGFMYNEDLEVYYLEYCDSEYRYTFVSESPNGDESWLIVCHIS